MRVWRLLPVLAGVLACAVSGGAARGAVGHSTLQIPCWSGVAAPADWYVPAGTPTGLVLLIHAYWGDKNSVSGLAKDLSARTGAIVVAPTVSSSPWAQGGCWILGEPLERAVAALFRGDRAALTASASAAGVATPLPAAAVLAGHSAGGNLALAAAGYGASANAVVMLDGGAGDDPSHAQKALAQLPPDFPVFQIASPRGSACIPRPVVTDALTAARPGRFVGVMVVGGSHLDATG